MAKHWAVGRMFVKGKRVSGTSSTDVADNEVKANARSDVAAGAKKALH